MSVRGWIAVTASAVALSGCGGKQGTPVSAAVEPDLSVPPVLIAGQALHFPGEYLAWKVKWKGLAGGSAQLVVGEPGDVEGHRAIIVRSINQTDGLVAVFKQLRDELTTVIDLETGAPIRSDNLVEEGKSSDRLEIRFSRGAYRLARRPSGADPSSYSQAIPDDAPWAHDMHSLLAHLRAWNPSPGQRGYFYIQSGRSFFRVELTARAVSLMDTPVGELEVIEIEGAGRLLSKDGKRPKKPVLRRFSMWFSTDPLRLPVKLLAETSYGDVYAELVEHRPGRAIERPTHVVGSEAGTQTSRRARD